MAGLLRQLFGERPMVPQRTLPTEGWRQAPGLGRMSLVWPWYGIDDPQPLVDSYGREVGVTPALELRAPRSDRDLMLIVWAEAGGGEGPVAAEWARSVARLHGARLEATRPFSLGGLPGRLARVSDGSDVIWRLIVPRPHDVVQTEVGVPRADAEAYWVQVESMLATWGWDG